MATFAIGDIHGCFRTLQHLVKAIRFDPGRDRLWLVGDLVNRGPGSLQVLRWVRQLGDRAVCVLGNHDLKLLACGLGVRSSPKNPQLSSILAAPDGEELLAWLGSRPPVHCEGEYVLVHAGLLPGWTVDRAVQLGREIQRSLRGPGAVELLKCLTAGNLSELKEMEPGSLRLATALRAMTQLRTLNPDGSMDLDFVGPLAEVPDNLIPWFSFPGRRNSSATIVFGHWAALGVFQAPGIAGLDSNCVRGGRLTAMRLEDGRIFQQEFLD
ncbi:MAG: symmetrical bis(5'-nucleosyl)-tetraphosphatase [Acidobacteriota bacterium]|nr:symmetrical bis(5'-nucleosyl)-tetraphosphatase [Acidobacteriota bacterium]MDE2962551.1 symmetrical bis(5'-nucleosyl)-tetraphosphatase [Acidobacteriota bacterium]